MSIPIISSSDHFLDVSAAHWGHDVRSGGRTFVRQNVDILNVINLVKNALVLQGLEYEDPEDVPLSKGKRKATPNLESKLPCKKPRTEDVSGDHELVEVLKHVFTLTTRSDSKSFAYISDNNHAEIQSKFKEEDGSLIELLRQHRLLNGENNHLSLGDANLIPSKTRFESTIALHSSSSTSDDSSSPETFVLNIPDIPDNLDLESLDFTAREDILLASCCKLEQARKISMRSSLSVALHQNQQDDTEAETVQFMICITVSLNLPSILQPIPFIGNAASQAITEAQRRLLTHLFPPKNAHAVTTDMRSFYAALQPAKNASSSRIEEIAQPVDLLPTLLPFQRRSILRLLHFEGKLINADGHVVPLGTVSDEPDPQDHLWQSVGRIGQIGECYFNRLTGALSLSKPFTRLACHGGLLAEEMGLGKTLECFALILLNPLPLRITSTKHWDETTEIHVSEVKTTLIVTPTSLAQQWADEAKRHAPTLKVLVYEGWSKLKTPISESEVPEARQKAADARQKTKSRGKRKGKSGANQTEDDDESDDEDDIVDWVTYVNRFDVVITTFPVLQSDLTVARAPVHRPRRATVLDSYISNPRPRSPLVMVEWRRVIMDEVQLVGDGRAAEMMSLIPRLSSLAVSGTPAKRSVQDLLAVLKFVRYDEQVTSPRHWKRIITPGFSDVFNCLFRNISIRTLKSEVQHELTIPTQKRYVVGVGMGRVERHIYDDSFEQALRELGVDARGVAAYPGWQLDVGLLRSWLRRLRAVATHPQIGQLEGRERILGGGGNLKSIGDVLEGMREGCWRAIMDARKSKTQANIRLAQLFQRDDKRQKRYADSLQMLLDCKKQALQQIDEIHSAIVAHKKEGKTLIDAAAQRRKENHETFVIDESDDSGNDSDGSTSGNSDNHRALPRTPAGEAHRVGRHALRARLRECKVMQHKIVFLLGDLYHTLGRSKEEGDAYGDADVLRRELLKVTERGAIRAMDVLSRSSKLSTFDPKTEMKLPLCEIRGIKTRILCEEGNTVMGLLTAQRDLLLEWRAHISGLLTEPLSGGDENGEVDGQEYARALDTQGEVEQYMQAYASLLADRRESLLAERTALATHEGKVTKLRQTKAAAKAAAIDVGPDDFIPADVKAEHEVLRAELLQKRDSIRQGFKCRALKSVMVGLNGVAANLVDKHPEKEFAKDEASKLRQLIHQQGQVHEKCDAELAQFRKSFNERLLYFRQLQELSDSVAEVELESTLEEATQETKESITRHEIEATAKSTHLKYLNTLASGSSEEEDDQCIICTDTYENGWMFDCAHRCCAACLKLYIKKYKKECPICRKEINFDTAQRIINTTVTEDENVADGMPKKPAPATRKLEYNRMPVAKWADIQKVETNGSYGSKIQSMVRHLVWLQETDPGTKSIVFSAWQDSLSIIAHALIANGISCIQVEAARGKKKNAAERFKSDPSILVFLLHGERENAGLNLVEAKRVFCIEPVVNHAFEMQAIARIDRLGQKSDTEVYCYYSEDTVERNILDLGVRQGMSLYTRDKAIGTLLDMGKTDNQAKSKKVDSEKTGKKVKGDFIHSADDMLAALFPHLFDDSLYDVDEEAPSQLLADPTGSSIEMDIDVHPPIDTSRRLTARLSQLNMAEQARAGPSGQSSRIH